MKLHASSKAGGRQSRELNPGRTAGMESREPQPRERAINYVIYLVQYSKVQSILVKYSIVQYSIV